MKRGYRLVVARVFGVFRLADTYFNYRLPDGISYLLYGGIFIVAYQDVVLCLVYEAEVDPLGFEAAVCFIGV